MYQKLMNMLFGRKAGVDAIMKFYGKYPADFVVVAAEMLHEGYPKEVLDALADQIGVSL